MKIPDKCDLCSKEDDLTQAIGLTFGKSLGREHFLCDGCYEGFFAKDTSEHNQYADTINLYVPLFERMPAVAQVGFLALIVLTSPIWFTLYTIGEINKK